VPPANTLEKSDIETDHPPLEADMFDIAAPIEEDAVPTILLVLAFTTAARDDDAVCTSESVAKEPVSSEAPVSVRVPALHTSVASEPSEVSVRAPEAQTAAGIPAIEETTEESVEPSEEDAANTMLLVLALTTAATDEDAVAMALLVLLFTLAATEVEAFVTVVVSAAVCVLVLELIPATTDDDAVCTSDCVASEPASSEAPVRVRVALDHTSTARLPKVVKLRVPDAHTAAGIPDMEEATEESTEPSEEDAAVTIELVFELTVAATDEDAVATTASVLALTAEVMPAVAELVLALTTAARELDAVSISDCVASEPELSEAPVSVRVPALHTSAASEPNEESVLVPYDHTSAGIVRNDEIIEESVVPRDEDAAVTTALVLALTSSATDEDETIFEVMTNVLSPLTKSPASAVPQEINAGHVPSVEAGVNE